MFYLCGIIFTYIFISNTKSIKLNHSWFTILLTSCLFPGFLAIYLAEELNKKEKKDD